MEEAWKDIDGYEGLYQVSNLGAVRAVERVVRYGRKLNGKGISRFLTKDGYLAVHLSRDGNARQHRIHRLVATAFLENPENMPQINHIDEDRTNNRVDNLEWCSVKYNINYGERNKRVSSQT